MLHNFRSTINKGRAEHGATKEGVSEGMQDAEELRNLRGKIYGGGAPVLPQKSGSRWDVGSCLCRLCEALYMGPYIVDCGPEGVGFLTVLHPRCQLCSQASDLMVMAT